MKAMPEQQAGGSRAVARQAVRAHVSSTARNLILEHGYDVITVEAICAAATISRSTFFRYFTSKDDAVLTDVEEASGILRDALCARPEDELVWTALGRAFDPLIARYDLDRGPARQLAALIAATPGLAAYQYEKHAAWSVALRPEVARRMEIDPTDNTDPRPAAAIGAALACLEAAVETWAATAEPTPITIILERAMGAVGR